MHKVHFHTVVEVLSPQPVQPVKDEVREEGVVGVAGSGGIPPRLLLDTVNVKGLKRRMERWTPSGYHPG